MNEIEPMKQSAMPTTGRWGWYKDHTGEEFRRVSKVIEKVKTDTFQLDQWKLRQAAVGLARRDDLILSIKALGRPGPEGWTSAQKKVLNDAAKTAQEAAKDSDGGIVGTAVHTMTERLDRGEDIEAVVRGLPWQAERDLRAYDALVTLNSWECLEIERTVVLRNPGPVAGTFDRIYVIPGLAEKLGPGVCQYGPECVDIGLPGHGDAVIGDVKTEKEPERNGLHIGPQLAIYSRALVMWAGNRYQSMPCVRQDIAVVVHVRDGKAVPYFVNLAAGWDAACAAFAQMSRETEAKRWLAPMPDVKEPKPAQLLNETAKAHDYANPNRPAFGVGDTTTVGGIAFTKIAEPASPEQVFGNPDRPRFRTGLSMDEPAPITDTTKLPAPVIETEPITIENGEDLRRMLIEAIWKATTLEQLGGLWVAAERNGVPWTGPVEQAGVARRRQIECPQRALHTGTGKCACGWMPPVPA